MGEKKMAQHEGARGQSFTGWWKKW